jgi:hypothetical protein
MRGPLYTYYLPDDLDTPADLTVRDCTAIPDFEHRRSALKPGRSPGSTTNVALEAPHQNYLVS